MSYNGIFCIRMDFTKIFVRSLDFAEIKNIENMSIGMTYRTHKALQLLLLLFLFIYYETVYQNKSLCLILNVDECFSFLA